MNILLVNVALAMIWAALTAVFTPTNLIIGFVLGYFILYLIRSVLGSTGYFEKARQIASFIIFFLWELFIANLRVAKRVLSPYQKMQPRVISIPLDTCKSSEITIIANLISLTPGTLSLDVSTDQCVLFVHVMDAPEPEIVRNEIKIGFEQRVLDLFRSSDRPHQGDS